MNNELYILATEIRSAQEAGENTADRVGYLLQQIVQAVGASLTAGNMSVQASSSGVDLVFDLEGEDEPLRVPVPVVSETQAGVITPTLISGIKALISTETSNRVAGDTQVLNAIVQIQTALNSSISTEATNRNSEDADIRTSITQLAATLNATIAEETTSRRHADTRLEQLLKGVHSESDALNFPMLSVTLTSSQEYTANQQLNHLLETMFGDSSSLNKYVGRVSIKCDGRNVEVFNFIKGGGAICQIIRGCVSLSPQERLPLVGDYAYNEFMRQSETVEHGLIVSWGGWERVNKQPVLENATMSAAGLMSASDKAKLNNIAYGAQVNVIEFIKVRGEAQPIVNKTVDLGNIGVGNIYNVTNQVPLTNGGYYSLINPMSPTKSAVQVAWQQRMAVSGLILSFEIAEGVWKTYQYTGDEVTEQKWTDYNNWTDFGSLAAGSEPFVIIDSLCGSPAVGYYDLTSAVTRLIAYQTEKGVTYAKEGLIISYKTAPNTMETKQFQGAVTDFSEVSLWKDFGGGGSKVEVNDNPEDGGKEAFSNGGAYTHIPTEIVVVPTEEDGKVTLAMKNAKGKELGDRVEFLVGTGSGESSGTIVGIAFERSPLYGPYGSAITGRCAIRSYSKVGNEESVNTIETLEIVDRDSGISVWSARVNQISSPSLSVPEGEDPDDIYTFTIDFTPFFTTAGARKFRLIATDDTGSSGTKNINVTAVDVTATCVQVMQYSQETAIRPTDAAVSIPMYKFANYQSGTTGISAKVEIYLNNAWQTVSEEVITDAFTHAITLRPATLGLQHGSYAMRIQGTDVASGTLGNMVYTSIMVVDAASNAPLVAIRYDDRSGGTAKLYESIALDVAAYTPGAAETYVSVKENGSQFTQIAALPGRTYQVTRQIKDVAADGSVTLNFTAENGTAVSQTIAVRVEGSAIDAQLKEGAIYSFDFAERSNDEADHTIADNGYTLSLNGANWRTNGFVDFNGERCLRIAENVTGSLNHIPFGASSIEATGAAIQFAFATKNIKDDQTNLIDCYDPTSGAGFYVRGNKVGIYCKNGISQREERSFRQGEKVTVGIVVEPTNIYWERRGTRYSVLKLYINGEMAAAIGYVGGTAALQQAKNITFNGADGDLYLYYLTAWQGYYEWEQAMDNYLVKLSDTAAMVTEYEFEDILTAQTAEGTTKNRPSCTELFARGIPYVVEEMSEAKFTEFDNGTSTDDNFECTLRYYDPIRPWRSFIAYNVPKRRQGTTSSKRPKKNDRYYLNKASRIEPIFPGYTNEDALITYALFEKKMVRVYENSIPVQIITIKIDFSDSTTANDSGVCEMMNATYRALGADYLTPAQRFFDGTWDNGDIHLTGLEMNHSTATHPVAVFRATTEVPDVTYFEARGNWKEDKKEQVALGFMNTPGYNLGCLNYQDWESDDNDKVFIEFFGEEGETIQQTVTRFLATEGLDTSKRYLISMYCGDSYRFMRYQNGAWTDTTGSMYQDAQGKWHVEGDVLNPVEGFELLNYQDLCWFRGISTVEDMMAPTTTKSKWVQGFIDDGKISADTFPAWTKDFEPMIECDQLAIDYALGKKVPYHLFQMLQFCESCNPDHVADWANRWKTQLSNFANPRSLMSYYVFTDYNLALDQQAKNAQPMWFLDAGASVTHGEYSQYAVKMYMNKIYDCDTCNGKDNEGGQTGNPECDPGKPTVEGEYTNPYAGWNSILWVNTRNQQEVNVSSTDVLSLRTVVAAMRSCQATVDGEIINPFSPAGAKKFFIDRRIAVWPKTAVSYDGERKYIQYTATSDAIYFYALQGSGRTSLPAFIETRWRFRDGYYQTGDFFSGVLSGRIACASNATITITAAKTGYFGIGNDAHGNLSKSVYLEAGESYTFAADEFSHQTGALLYIYQADRMKSIDLSKISLSENFDFSVMKLAESIILGSNTHTNRDIGYNALKSLPLGDLPFLETIDIRKTLVTTMDASGCPRLLNINAKDSDLQSLAIAETSPIDNIILPETMTELKLVGLPELTYSGLAAASGLQATAWTDLQRLRIEDSPELDALALVEDVLNSQEAAPVLQMLRLANQTMKGNGELLLTISESSIGGMDIDGNRTAKPYIKGTYELTVIREAWETEQIEQNIDAITLFIVIEAYIDMIDQMNAEAYCGDAEVQEVTLENIGDHLHYYNGETYEDYVDTLITQEIGN